jgi:hypothetical protein
VSALESPPFSSFFPLPSPLAVWKSCGVLHATHLFNLSVKVCEITCGGRAVCFHRHETKATARPLRVALEHDYTHMHTHAHTCTHIHTHTHTQTHRHIHKCIHTRIHTHTHMYSGNPLHNLSCKSSTSRSGGACKGCTTIATRPFECTSTGAYRCAYLTIDTLHLEFTDMKKISHCRTPLTAHLLYFALCNL